MLECLGPQPVRTLTHAVMQRVRSGRRVSRAALLKYVQPNLKGSMFDMVLHGQLSWSARRPPVLPACGSLPALSEINAI